MRAKEKSSEEKEEIETSDSGLIRTWFDINQFELAVINYILENKKPDHIKRTAQFSKLPVKTLKTQKANLEKLLVRLGLEHDPKSLGNELKLILNGGRMFSLSCFSTLPSDRIL